MGVLNDVGTEELAHLEIVSTIVHQLTQNLSMEEIEESGFGPYYIDHTIGVWPQAAAGIPLNSCEFQSKGDPITDLFENLAAEQKARSTYDNILRVVKNMPEVADPIRFLRAREVVHFQRFGETKRAVSSRSPPHSDPPADLHLPIRDTDCFYEYIKDLSPVLERNLPPHPCMLRDLQLFICGNGFYLFLQAPSLRVQLPDLFVDIVHQHLIRIRDLFDERPDLLSHPDETHPHPILPL